MPLRAAGVPSTLACALSCCRRACSSCTAPAAGWRCCALLCLLKRVCLARGECSGLPDHLLSAGCFGGKLLCFLSDHDGCLVPVDGSAVAGKAGRLLVPGEINLSGASASLSLYSCTEVRSCKPATDTQAMSLAQAFKKNGKTSASSLEKGPFGHTCLRSSCKCSRKASESRGHRWGRCI